LKVDHPIISIDGIPLDFYLHNLYPDSLYLGLIPTIIDWITVQEDTEIILSRYYSEEETSILPILMCPDDCDLSCTVIVAEILKTDNLVIWRRIGVDNSKYGTPIGSEVLWLDLVPEMKFNSRDYFEKLNIIYKNI